MRDPPSVMPETPEPPHIPDYTLLRPIGRGSYGEVWLARSVTGVFRVIKIVRRSRFEDERPFLRELEGISRFQAAVSGRPRQLALLHVGRNDAAGYFYYVMEPADDAEAGSAIDPDRYVPLTLKELFARRGRLPAAECIQIALELARGLAVLHEVRLVHRDIKPSNIIFVQQVPKLADVGLVAATEATMTCVGTPGYVPPEGPGSISGDVYSFGKVLYELSTGLDRMEFPRLPEELIEGSDSALLREINSIVLRACHPDPRERQASAAVLARELELVQAGKSVAFYENLRRRFRRIAVAAAFGITIACAIVGLLIWRSQVLGKANQRTRLALYRSDLAVAQLAKASGDLGRARAALERQIPAPGERDLRGLEWSILNREVQGEGTPFEALTNGVGIRKLAVDPGGRWLAASFNDDRVGIWDIQTGRIVRVFDNAKVLGGFTEDGRIVVDEPIRALRFESPTNGPLGRINTGQRLISLLSNSHYLVVSPPPGDWILSVIDAANAAPPTAQFNVSASWPDFRVSAMDAFPDGSGIAIGLFKEEGALRERMVAYVDLLATTKSWSSSVSGRIVWLRCSPDGRHFAVNVGGLTPILFSSESSEPRLLTGHTARVQDAAFSLRGGKLATAGADQAIGVWDVETGKLEAFHRGLGRPAAAVAWSPDSKIVFGADDSGNIRAFRIPPPQQRSALEGVFGDVHGDMVFDPSARTVAVTDASGRIALVSANDLEFHERIEGVFQPIAFSKSGDVLWAFTSDWTIKRVDLKNGTQDIVFSGLPGEFSMDAWGVSPTQTKVIVSGNAGQLHIIDLESGRVTNVTDQSGESTYGIAFTADSREFWTGNTAGLIRRRHVESGEILEDVARADGEVQALALSSDGRWLAAAIYNDATIAIWDRARSKWLPPLTNHRRFVQSLLFSLENNRLISGGADGRVIIWRIPGFEEIATLDIEQRNPPTGDEGVATLKLAPDGSALSALTEDGRLCIWRIR